MKPNRSQIAESHPWLVCAGLILTCLVTSRVVAEEACQFDQADQIAVLQKLHADYPGSKLNIAEKRLTMDRGNAHIEFQRGGCEHLGISITYRSSDNVDYSNQARLFKQATALIDEFGQELISTREVTDLLTAGQYTLIQNDKQRLYIVQHDSLTYFEISQQRDGDTSIIKVSYYL